MTKQFTSGAIDLARKVLAESGRADLIAVVETAPGAERDALWIKRDDERLAAISHALATITGWLVVTFKDEAPVDVTYRASLRGAVGDVIATFPGPITPYVPEPEPVRVFILAVTDSDGETFAHAFSSREKAEAKMREWVADLWVEHFETEPMPTDLQEAMNAITDDTSGDWKAWSLIESVVDQPVAA